LVKRKARNRKKCGEGIKMGRGRYMMLTYWEEA
jgi:hypothetical protein